MGVYVRTLGMAAVLLALAACAPRPSGPATVRIDGSSTSFPVSESVAESFITEQRGRVRVTVGESGTGGGFAKFCRGEVDITGASRPISSEEIEACGQNSIAFVEAPVVYDGITVVVHPSNPIQSATVEELRRMWEPAAEARVTNWNQINPAWPDLPLTLFGAGTASGTFDFFTEAVVGTASASRLDFTPTEDDNVTVQGVSTTPGAIGYFGIAYYLQNQERLRALAIDVGDGAGPVAPTVETVASGAYQPLSRPVLIYVNADALQRPEVMQLALYYLQHAAETAVEVGYVPLPDRAYVEYAERLRNRTVGTAFGGRNAVGLTIDELLALPVGGGEAPE